MTTTAKPRINQVRRFRNHGNAAVTLDHRPAFATATVQQLPM
jgi:hypothetical protein